MMVGMLYGLFGGFRRGQERRREVAQQMPAHLAGSAILTLFDGAQS